VDETNLAIDAIRDVGPGGNFLSHKHTRQHMRERWLPTLMDRRPYEAWEENQDGSREWARDKAINILKEHKPEPLDSHLHDELNKIISSLEVEH